MMRERLATWCASLQIRLIITSVAVTTFSFILLFLLLRKPVETVLMNRERAKLEEIAHMLGTTVRTPWMITPSTWYQEVFWTQRRCHDLAPVINARIRMLDAHGQVLTDSFCRGKEHSPSDPNCNRNLPVWERERHYYSNLSDRREVQDARMGLTTSSERLSQAGQAMLYVVKPILRETARASGKQHVAFIFYIDKPLAVTMKEVHKEYTLLERLFLTCAIISLLATITVSAVVSGPLSADLRSATRIAQHFAAGGCSSACRSAVAMKSDNWRSPSTRWRMRYSGMSSCAATCWPMSRMSCAPRSPPLPAAPIPSPTACCWTIRKPGNDSSRLS